MNILSGIIKKIRGILKAGKPGKDEVIEILQEAFAQNFLFINGEKTNASLSKVTADEFENTLPGIKSGFLCAGLSGSERPQFILLYPADCMRQLLPIIKKQHPAPGGDSAAVMNAMDWLKGGIGRLFQPKENPGAIEPENFLFIKKSYASADKDGLLWYVSGYIIFNITAGPVTFFLFVNEDTEKILGLNLKYKSFRKSAWEMARSAYSPDASLQEKSASDVMLRLEKPKEFIVGNLLIPQVAAFDRFRIKSVFKNITAGNFVTNSIKDGLWILIFLTSGGSETSINYFIPGVSKKDFAERFGDPNTFFKYLLKDVMLFLKANCPALAVSFVKLSVDLKPDAAAIAKCIQLSGELFVNYSRMGISVYVPGSYFDMVYPLLLKSWEYRLTVKSLKEYLVPVLSLNIALFNKNITHFIKKYKGGLAYLPAATTCIPVYELMDLMDNFDLRILIQNFLIPKYSTGIARLFNIGISVKNEAQQAGKRSGNVFQVAYDKERIHPMMPTVIAEEIGRKEEYIMADEFDTFNKGVLKEIMKAIAAGRITISYKTRYIFLHEINDIINQDDVKRLEDLRSRGIPFNTLKKLPKNRMINFVNKIGNPDLCKAVIDSEEEIAILQSCMSKARKEQFADDIIYFRQQYADVLLTPEEIVAAKLKINDLLEKEIKSRRDNAE